VIFTLYQRYVVIGDSSPLMALSIIKYVKRNSEKSKPDDGSTNLKTL